MANPSCRVMCRLGGILAQDESLAPCAAQGEGSAPSAKQTIGQLAARQGKNGGQGKKFSLHEYFLLGRILAHIA
jgi:hypothetical protein